MRRDLLWLVGLLSVVALFSMGSNHDPTRVQVDWTAPLDIKGPHASTYSRGNRERPRPPKRYPCTVRGGSHVIPAYRCSDHHGWSGPCEHTRTRLGVSLDKRALKR